jgi:hypothetical protein
MKTIFTLVAVIALSGCATLSDTASNAALAKDIILLIK